MLDLEADFLLNELFFSKTDFKGLIQTGNKVFLRVAEYQEDEVLHRPHNIIRHPDMPRSVFKIFWEFLKSKRPICAYVKNRSKSGRFYWVFAMAFPMEDGYLSIRLKPSTALLAEMKSREGLLMASHACTKMAREAFDVVDQLNERTRTLKTKSQEIDRICREVQMVTTNLTISAAKLGEAGKPLGVVSNNLEKLTADILSNSLDFEKTFTSFNQAASEMYLAIGVSRFQIEMMNHLIEESLPPNDEQNDFNLEQEQQLMQNCELLKHLITSNFATALSTAKDLTQKSKSLIRSIGMLSKVTAGMDVICVMGKIEMSRVNEMSSSLDALLEDMESLTDGF